jgi:peroxiredoxin
VSKEFVESVFKPTRDNLLQFEKDVEVPIPGPNPTYHVSVTSVEPLQFNDGSIDLIVKAKATHGLLPNFENIVIRQRLRFVVSGDTLLIAARDDELTVSGLTIDLPFPVPNINLPTDRVRSEIIAARDEALPLAQDALDSELPAARTRLNEALHKFDPSASAFYVSVAIMLDAGIIVRGDIAMAPRPVPVVDIRETSDETAFTAFESWVPAGRLERLIWSWVEYPGLVPSVWSGVSKSLTDEHRFILPKPPGITDRSQICLRIEGHLFTAGGVAIGVAGGTTCLAPEPGVIMNVPSWWEPVMVPIWRPDVPADAVVRDAIAGHVTVQADTAPRDALTHNSLVYFADWERDAPLGPLREAFAQVRRGGVSLVVFVVVPAGAFDARRRELEAKLASIGEHFSSNLHVTEDDEGGWTRTFAPSRRPAVFLINARRQFVWKHEGAADARTLAAAIEQRLEAAPAPRSAPLRLTVSPGDRAPDGEFHDDRGQLVALHRLRGRRLLLNFWQSWSAPSLNELRRLQTRPDPGGGERPLVVALHGGRQNYLQQIRKELGLTFLLAQDVEQQVARSYGVRCWPSTVCIDPAGRVEHVQFGVADHHERYQGDAGRTG